MNGAKPNETEQPNGTKSNGAALRGDRMDPTPRNRTNPNRDELKPEQTGRERTDPRRDKRDRNELTRIEIG